MALQEHTLALISLAWARALGLPDDGLGTLGATPASGTASPSSPPGPAVGGSPAAATPQGTSGTPGAARRIEVVLGPTDVLPGDGEHVATVLRLGEAAVVAGPEWFVTACRDVDDEVLALESTLLRIGAGHGARSRGEHTLYYADEAPAVDPAQSIAVSFDSAHALEVGALCPADDVTAAALPQWNHTAALVPVFADGQGGGVACAAAGYDVLSGIVARLGVLAVPHLRGKGLGTYAAAAAMESAWLDGLVPSARVPEGHTQAHHIAVAVGMEPLGTQTSIRWGPQS